MKVILLGATGSIGTQTLEIVRKNNEDLLGSLLGKTLNLQGLLLKNLHHNLFVQNMNLITKSLH